MEIKYTIYILYWIGCVIAMIIITHKLLTKNEEFTEKIKDITHFVNPSVLTIIVVVVLIFISLFSWFYVIHILNKKRDD